MNSVHHRALKDHSNRNKNSPCSLILLRTISLSFSFLLIVLIRIPAYPVTYIGFHVGFVVYSLLHYLVTIKSYDKVVIIPRGYPCRLCCLFYDDPSGPLFNQLVV